MYLNYIKRDGSYNTGEFPNYGRSTTMFKSREVNKTWPFNVLPNPYFEGWPFPAVTGEGITIIGPDDRGQIRINLDGPSGIKDIITTNTQNSTTHTIAETILLILSRSSDFK